MFGRQEYREINGNLNRQLEEKQVLIAVHRGTWGGNVIQNTIQAYRIALDMGGDIFECDAALSADGVFYAFHDGTEPINLGREENLTTLPSQEIDRLVCINSAYGPSGVHVEKLEDVLQAFTHGELFNIDRAWEHLPQLDALLARYPHVLGQALVKTPVREEYLEFFRRCPRKYMYMAIVRTEEEVRQALGYPGVNLVGMEFQASTPQDSLYQDEAIRSAQEAGVFVWANAIKLWPTEVGILFAGLDDDAALAGDPDGSWGEMMRKGVRVIQTDWPWQLSRYRARYFGKA